MRSPGFAWADWAGVLFDLDGVITPTAAVHEHAWLTLFAPWNATPEDYLRYIDGRPRYQGVETFLASRNITLPWGSPDDPPGTDTICAMGNSKNDLFREILERDGVTPYAGSIAVLDLLDRIAVPYAVVSSSRNANPVLHAAGLSQRFDVVIDGLTADELDLPGKPDPAMFLLGSERIGVPTASTVVVEDATAGVRAGVAGGFGWVLGVDRGGNAAPLREAGATVVVDDLAETLPSTQLGSSLSTELDSPTDGEDDQ